MNQLSAAGGGVLYLGAAYFTGSAAYMQSTFSRFDLTAELVPAPTISSISPDIGPTSGPYRVTISGTNLGNATGVTFGGVPGAITGFTPTALEVFTPALYTARTVDVVVTGPGGTATATNGFTAVDAPTISTVSPSTGTRGGGQTVTITGTNLTGASAVSFGGGAGSNITVDGPTQLRVTTPVRWDGAVDVTVTAAGGAATLPGAYTFVSPEVTITAPTQGATVTGPNVTVTGTAAHVTSVEVFLDFVTQGSVPVVNGQWTKTFSGLPGNHGYTVAAQATDGLVPSPMVTAAFTVTVSAPLIYDRQPTGGPESGGFPVVISGAALTGATAVTFGATPATSFIVDSDTQITAIAPSGTGVVDISVTTPAGDSGAGGSSTSFLYVASPTISAISPSNGPTSGSTAVTLTGTNLADVTSVTFGGAAATIVGTPTATTINVTAPSGALGLADVVVTTPDGSITRSGGYSYEPPAPTISNLSPNTGPTSGGGAVVITGSDLSQYTGVTFGGQVGVIVGTDPAGATAYVRPPAHAAGTVDVVYTTHSGSVTATNGYTYLPSAPVASNTTASAVAYNAGSAPATTFSLAAHATNSPTGYAAGSSTTANGGSVDIDDAGLVSYTPPAGFRGHDSFTFTASNLGGTSSPATVTVPVSDPVFTVTLAETAGYIGSTYNASLVPVTISGGKAPYTVTAVTGYPRTLGFNAATQVLSGWVSEDGNWTVNFTVTDSSTGTGPYASTTSAALVTAYPERPTATSFTASAVAYNNGSASATTIDVASHAGGIIVVYWLNNGSGGVRASTTTAQGGSASIDTATGQVSYTPPVGFRGDDTFQFASDNARGRSTWETVTVPVNDPVFTVTLPQTTGQVGVAYNSGGAAVSVSGGAATYSNFSATGLPTGLTMDSAGVISGTPSTGGAATVVVTVTDQSTGAGPYTATASATLTIAAPTIILSPAAGALPDATAGEGYSQAITSTGGFAPIAYSVSAGSTPPGTALAGDGLLSGTPTQTGTFHFTVTARDSSSNVYTAQAAYSVTVGEPVITITSPASGALPNGMGGVAYSRSFTATGGVGALSFALADGALPPGLTLSAEGALSGTPTQAGSFSFTVVATDASPAPGPFASVGVAYTLEITQPAIVLTPAAGALPGAERTAAYSQAITASGGTAPYAYAVTTGALPDGLALASDGALSGTPATAGSNSFTVKATDAYGFTQSAAYTLEVGTPVAVAQPKTVVAIGGQSLVINAAEGAVGLDLIEAVVVTVPAHGAATVDGLAITYTADGGYTGSDSFTYAVRNAGGLSAPVAVTITVNAAVRPGPDKAVTILAGQTAVVELTEGAFGSPFTGAAVVSILPANAGVATIAGRTSADGRQLYDLSFKPDDAFTGAAVASYTLSNAFSTSAPGKVTITVEARPDPTQDPEVSGLVTAQGEAARRFATAQISNVNRRLEQLHDGRSGQGFSSGFSLSGGASANDPDALRRRMRDGQGVIGAATGGAGETSRRGKGLGFDDGLGLDPRADAGAGAPDLGAGDSDQGLFGVWVSGAATFGRTDDGRNRQGFKFDTDGLTIGVDQRLGKTLVLGGALGWATDTSRIGDNGTRSQADAFSASLYGSWQPTRKAYLDVVLGYGRLDFDSRRYVTANGDFATGQRDGDQWFGAVTASWDIRDLRGVHLTPYGRMEATRSLLGSFTEEGGGAYALAYDRQTTRTLTGAFGLRGDYALKTRLGQALPSFRIEYSYDLQGSGAQSIRYADWLDGQAYSFDVSPLDRNRLLYGLGVDLLRGGGMRVGVGYEGTLSGDQTSGSLRAKLQTSF